ncbi:MAG: hypothetical protein D8M58_19520 [Calditrichaeota bacterium]|nr:MAG: hypothetical protein DWQ03_22200 [Calditrichota bacterium]MBL1207600.1 hypothetical protein [Calditrichota bacterium]NOG47433.1 oligosaccharide flippase family protein [Calditrichota bacterium]
MSIKSHLKNLTRHSLVYTISTFIQRTLGLVMMPIYTSEKFLASKADYGDLSLFYAFTAFMVVLYLYGMDSAFMRYYFLGKHKRHDIYKTAFLGVSANALVLSAIIFFSAPYFAEIIFSSADYSFPIQISAAILFLDTFSNLPYLILRVEEKSTHFSVIKIVRFLIELGLNILFVVYYKMGFIGVLYANIIAAFINVIILLPYQVSYLKGSWNSGAFKQLAYFGIPLIPNGIAYLIVEVSDKLLMNHLLGKELLGLYSANYKFGTILVMLVMAFRTAWQPFFLKIAEKKEAKEVYSRVLTYFTLVGVIIVILVSYLIEYLVQIPLPGGITLLGKEYWPGTSIIPIILTSYLFYGLYVNFTVGIYIKKKSHLMIIFTGLAALVNVGSNLYLMPAYGIMGAAFATFLSYFVMAVTIFIANNKIYPIKYDYSRILFLLGFLAVMLVIFYYFQPQIWSRIILLGSTPIIFWATGFFKRSEIDTVKSLIKMR